MTNTAWYHIYVEFFKAWFKETESRVFTTVCMLANGEILLKVYKLLLIRLTRSGALMYSMVAIPNNTMLCA